MLETLFIKNKNEQYQDQTLSPTSENVTSLSTELIIKNGNNSFDGANFGVQNIIYLYPEHSASNHVLDSSVVAKLDSIKNLMSSYKLAEALEGYQELLKDYTVMNAIDKSLQSRILLGIVSIYIRISDFTNAEKYLDLYKKQSLPIDDKGYSIIISYYLNQRNYSLCDEANRIATKALEDFPDSLTCKCLYALAKTIVDGSFDGKKYLDENVHPLNDSDDKKLYYEALCNIFTARRLFDNLIDTYNELEIKPSLLLHSQYINALYIRTIYNRNDKKFIYRADIDFAKLYEVWQTIVKIENKLTENEVEFFRCLIADVYLNCVVLLGKESNIVSQNLLMHVQEETINNYSFFMSTHPDFTDNSKAQLAKSEKVNFIENLLKDRRFIDIYNYLWPAIKEDKELQRLFKYHLLNTCLDMRNEKPNSFVECINHFKQAGLFDDYMKFLECVYIYRTESKHRALQGLNTLYVESQDPIVILELIRFTCKEGEFTFASDKLSDIKNNKPFIIDIEPNDYFEQRLNLYFNSEQNAEVIGLFNEASKHSIDEILKLRISVAKSEYTGDLPTIAVANVQLYNATKDARYLYRACETYIDLFDVQQLSDSLNVLSHLKDADDINVNVLYTYYYILKGEIDKALEFAKKAKDLSVDLPMSPGHQLYWSLCFRNNNFDGLSYIGEYTSKYPRHTQWVKKIVALEDDEDGNEVLTPEVIRIFEDARNDYEKIMSLYEKRYEFGISMIRDRMQ